MKTPIPPSPEPTPFKLPPPCKWRFVAFSQTEPGSSFRIGTVTARTRCEAQTKVLDYFVGGYFKPQWDMGERNPVRMWPADDELVIP